METHEKIRLIRELNHWSQEEIAEKLEMSASGYAKIERGETQLNLVRLQKLADIFNIDILELLQSKQGVFVQINGGNQYSFNSTDLQKVELLELELKHCKEMLEQKDSEIAMLKKTMALLEEKIAK